MLPLFGMAVVIPLKKRLNSLYRRAVKFILPEKSLTTDEKFKDLEFLSLHTQLAYNKRVFMYKALNNNSPTYISNLFHLNESHHPNFKHNLRLPRPKLDLYKTAISFSGACLWNNFPLSVKSSSTLKSFKHNLQAHLRPR